MSGRSDLNHALAELLQRHPEGRTARELARGLRTIGLQADRSLVNSVLYRSRSRFIPDGSSPPRWSLANELPEVGADQFRRVPNFLLVRNWKSFGESVGLIPLSDITLVYGANSSGKTSLLQSLLVLKQSWGTGRLVLDGPNASCGGFRNAVHAHDESQSVALGIGCRDYGDEIYDFGALWAVSEDGSEQGHVTSVGLQVGDSTPMFHLLGPDSEYWVSKGPESKDVYQALGGSAASLGEDLALFFEDRDGLPGELLKVQDVGGDIPLSPYVRRRSKLVMKQAASRIEELLARVDHLGPMRKLPPRWLGLDELGQDAELGRLRDDADLREDVNESLGKLEVPYRVEFEDVEGGTPLVGLVLVRIGTRGERVRLQDVGYGVSQLLPIVIRAHAGRERLILVEQPEVHLHPRLQAEVADLLVTSVQDYKNRVLVETHSEHLLLRLQRRIAEKRIDRDDVRVYYVSRDGPGAEIEQLELREDGQMADRWPAGFFDDRLDDLIAIADPGLEPE